MMEYLTRTAEPEISRRVHLVSKVCRAFFVTCLFAFSLVLLSPASKAQTVLQNRITEPLTHANVQVLQGTLHPRIQSSLDAGLTDNSKVLEGMSINFKR